MNNQKKVKHTIRTEVDDFGRKKFHLEEGEEEIVEDEPKVIQTGNTKSLLIGREEDLNIDKYMGRIEKNKKDKNKEVFYCQVCKEGFKCDLAYITHLNSAQHNSKLGMSMKVRAVSAEEVSAKLAALKNNNNNKSSVKKEDKQTAKSQSNQKITNKDVKQQAQLKKEQHQQQKQEEQELEQDSEQEDLQAALRAYGLPSSFGSKKTKH